VPRPPEPCSTRKAGEGLLALRDEVALESQREANVLRGRVALRLLGYCKERLKFTNIDVMGGNPAQFASFNLPNALICPSNQPDSRRAGRDR
jgi:hypothetical protein